MCKCADDSCKKAEAEEKKTVMGEIAEVRSSQQEILDRLAQLSQDLPGEYK